jgi:uncharacterized protein (TIGR03435 family)
LCHTQKMLPRLAAYTALAATVTNLSYLPRVRAQSPEFEVAVIKPTETREPLMIVGPGLRNRTFRAENVTLRMILSAAYGLSEPRIIGPGWLDQKHFDFAAKSPEGVSDSELKPMLQALLRDRFRLAGHIETRETSVYFLEVAKGGVKMQVYSRTARAPAHPPDSARTRSMMMGTRATTARLAENFSRVLGRAVIDRTGLAEQYSYSLSYAPLTPAPDAHLPEFSAPDFFTAVQQQLGLKLQPGRDHLDVFVMDHMEQMPTEN